MTYSKSTLRLYDRRPEMNSGDIHEIFSSLIFEIGVYYNRKLITGALQAI